MIMETLTYANLKALIPEVEKAETEYWQRVEQVRTNEEMKDAVADFNKVLDKAIDAIYEDTKDRNSKSTLQQVFRATGAYETHFGISPARRLNEIAQGRW